MDQPSHKEERIEDATKGLRNEAQEVSEQALPWEGTLTNIGEYLASRPWLVFGAFCAIAFIFSHRNRQKRRAGSEYSPRNLATRLGPGH